MDLTGPSAKLLAPDSDIIVSVLPSGDAIKTEADLRRVLSTKRSRDILSLAVYNTDTRTMRVVNIRVGG